MNKIPEGNFIRINWIELEQIELIFNRFASTGIQQTQIGLEWFGNRFRNGLK